MLQCRTSISRLFVLIVADLDYLFELNHDCNTSHHSVKLIEWLREACNKKKIKSLVFFTPFIIYHIVIYVDIKKYWFILLFPTFPNTFPHWKLPSSTFKITLLISAVVKNSPILYSADHFSTQLLATRLDTGLWLVNSFLTADHWPIRKIYSSSWVTNWYLHLYYSIVLLFIIIYT